ncbi:MAG TPA: hypothetical protein P5567_08235 [Kiritimatiellia bacterium]|nr:hypothetical protein [Kiritimatiellia bacterium]HRZ12429.1 hypothetical protein [Kiritimatiellia bacterium]HSA17813.1 hypothetical protein [Kiritimatiellia bacterium]
MKKWKIFAGIALIFAAGFVSGITVTRGVVRRRVAQWATWNPEATRRAVLAHLTRELKLTPRQQDAIEPILAALQQDLQHVRSQLQPEVHRIVVEKAREMAPYLTPEQQTGLRLFLLQQRARWTDPK